MRARSIYSIYDVIIAADTNDDEKLAAVKQLLDTGSDRNERGGDKRNTLLHEAAERGYTEILASLLEHGAEVDAINNDGYTPLHAAASRKNVNNIIEKLIAKGADRNKQCRGGWTPLHRAVYFPAVETVKVLIAQKVALDIGNLRGDTPLHIATNNDVNDDREIIVTALVEAGADLKAKNVARNTPLDEAVENRQLETAKILLAKIYQQDLTSPVYLGLNKMYDDTISLWKTSSVEEKETSLAPLRLANFVMGEESINEQNIDGKTLLDIAVEKGHLEAAKILLAKLYQKDLTNPIYLAMKKIYDDAIPLWKNGSTEDRKALTESLLLANKVVTSDPADRTTAAEALNKNALTLAQGKPSTWKKFIGALTALAGVVVLALSIAGVLFSGGASLIGMYVTGSLLAAGGLTLFGGGLQRGFSKDLSTLSHVATPKPIM